MKLASRWMEIPVFILSLFLVRRSTDQLRLKEWYRIGIDRIQCIEDRNSIPIECEPKSSESDGFVWVWNGTKSEVVFFSMSELYFWSFGSLLFHFSTVVMWILALSFFLVIVFPNQFYVGSTATAVVVLFRDEWRSVNILEKGDLARENDNSNAMKMRAILGQRKCRTAEKK